MSGDIRQFLEQHKFQILFDKRRLGLVPKQIEEQQNFNESTEKGERQLQGTSGVESCRSELEENLLAKSGVNFSSSDKEQGKESTRSPENDKGNEICRDEDKENRLETERKSPGSALRCTDNEDKGENLEFENVPSVVGPLDLPRCYELPLEDRKQVLIDRLINSEGPFSSRSDGALGRTFARGGASFAPPVLRRGEYAPTSYSSLRAAPHEGLGEYEIRRGLFQERRKRDYLRHLAKVQYDHLRGLPSPEKDLSPRRTVTDDLVDAALRKCPYRIDQRLTSAQNELLLRGSGNSATAPTMDKPKSILSNRRTGSPRDRYANDMGQTSYIPTSFMDGFSYTDRTEELEREKMKRENYQQDLRLQIEEKRRLQAMREDQERREMELENRRLEQQVLRMQEEQMVEEQRRARRNELMRRHSDDLLRRKTELHEMQRPWRRHADSESANLDSLGLGTSPSAYGGLGGSHYSPPVSRRVPPYTSYNVPATSVFPESNTSRYNPNRFDSSSYGSVLRKDTLKRMDSLNSYDTVPLRSHRRFDRFDSLSRIDSLSHRLETMSVRDGVSTDLTDVQRRHSATQQDLSLLRKSPRLRRRNSSSRFEDSLPIPVLKARSPVAKELKNAIPFSSHKTHGSEVQRRLEDRWQVPAVQKNILHSVDSPGRGSILTQLGSIRAQLQREQLRMDETLRRRGLVRTRTTEDY